jgi:urease accessory protein
MTVPMYLDDSDPGMAFVYVQNPTGAIFGGDRLTTRIAVGAGGRVHLTTPSATKIMRMESGSAEQRLEVELGGEAYLEYLPELLIPQAGSRYEQDIQVTLGKGAAFISAESVAPGRLAAGEAFAYQRLRLSLTIRTGGRDVSVDTLDLEPSRRSPTSRGLLGPYPYIGSIVAARADCPKGLASALDQAIAGSANVLAAAGDLPAGAGAYARVLAFTPGELRRTLDVGWEAARLILTGHPAPRGRK